MIGLVRAATLCATLALGLVMAQAADKAFRRDDLADSALKLEAQIKSEAGPVAKSRASLRTDADAAFRRSNFRTGLQILGQIAATAPEDSGNWLRLARTIFQIRPSNSSEQTFLMERASTAAYIAYQRAGNTGGVLPMTMLVNGVSVGEIDGRRHRLVESPGPGFARLTVIDATGAADTVVIRIQ
jgi:membrane carboxypeptidase/penicillin-binding protein PbpC